MRYTAEPVARLIEELHRLPGVGPKSAQRLAYHLLRAPVDQSRALAQAIIDMKERVIFCSVCFNITEANPCDICTSPVRDRSRICIVEEPLDVLAVERTGEYRGLYHVLHGSISPVEGIGPDELRIRELLARLQDGSVQELILATNPNLEGEATAMYIAKLVQPLEIMVTRLARGLPMGSDLEYADPVTLSRALEGRSKL